MREKVTGKGATIELHPPGVCGPPDRVSLLGALRGSEKEAVAVNGQARGELGVVAVALLVQLGGSSR